MFQWRFPHIIVNIETSDCFVLAKGFLADLQLAFSTGFDNKLLVPLFQIASETYLNTIDYFVIVRD